MKDLTKRQQQVLAFITDFYKENQHPPSIREAASHFKVSAKAMFDHFKALQKKDYLSNTPHQSRSYIVTKNNKENSLRNIPILGKIRAGTNCFSEENYEGKLTMAAKNFRGGEYFALHIEGDSMIESGIIEGDMAIIKKQQNADNGDIVAVRLEDESVTLKRFFREPNRVRLQPENKAYDPIYITSPDGAFILGILYRLVRDYN